jgi:hypothetical protein
MMLQVHRDMRGRHRTTLPPPRAFSPNALDLDEAPTYSTTVHRICAADGEAALARIHHRAHRSSPTLIALMHRPTLVELHMIHMADGEVESLSRKP